MLDEQNLKDLVVDGIGTNTKNEQYALFNYCQLISFSEISRNMVNFTTFGK